MEELEEKGAIYEVGKFKGNSVWLADDTTIIANSKENLEKNMRVLKEAAKKYGLEISKEKTKIIQVRGEKRLKEIEGYEIVEKTKYLGIMIGGQGRDIFKYEREEWIIKANKALGRLIKEIGKCYDRTSVGKVMWKQVLLAAVMYGKAVVTHSEAEIRKVQTIEYRVYRYLIGVGGYTTVAALRSEVGASKIISRVMETVLLFVKDTLGGEFIEVKECMEKEIQRGKGKWIKRVNNYMQTLNMSWEKMRELTRTQIKGLVREWDTETWRMEMMNSPTMKWYREAKLNIKYDKCYSNKISSNMLAKARTNSLQVREVLGRRKDYKEANYDTTCQLCGKEPEDLEHFLIKCDKLKKGRNNNLMKEAEKIKTEEKLQFILFKSKRWEEAGNMIFKLWHIRKILLKPP